MARPAVHEELDDGTSFWGEVRLFRLEVMHAPGVRFQQ
jgi:hypothetical protein